MKNIDKIIIVLIVLVSFFMGVTLGIYNTETRQEKMAKETGTIFIKSQPYKISPIKEIVIEMKTN